MEIHKRSPCPVACALDIIGDKWTILVIRDLALGRQYFKEFLASPEGIATNILTNRLQRLKDAGIISALPDPGPIGRFQYRLTQKGQAMQAMIEAMAEWGLRYIEGTSKRLDPI
jgi:DNA-binding HxlR family transcriptional regulator